MYAGKNVPHLSPKNYLILSLILFEIHNIHYYLPPFSTQPSANHASMQQTTCSNSIELFSLPVFVCLFGWGLGIKW